MYAPPAYFRDEQKVREIREYLQDLSRPEVHYVDASGDVEHVYEKVKQYVIGRMPKLGSSF